ncbi:molybdate transport system regulatory protein [Desulfonatronum thiosulfatophilum]|uniref:Molybdate transport system regulatory protein n=1 Tax=Desulfonatronum thiosulfatophilum TaxID=617002 RepID=A0A1G6DW68_9BACT|nr:TOBE domain-containing protein [Desulfonatronum thiosulfatophilum]SDB49393.1 molybdate transport system regulatory protein [Desulfonatronum thiosulfatophilum]
MDSFFDDDSRSRFRTGTHFSVPPDVKMLDSVQLAEMERSFRNWVNDSVRQDVRRSRRRILLIFLLIRHTGAKLHEILELQVTDINLEERVVRVGGEGAENSRQVEIPDDLVEELRQFLASDGISPGKALFRVDPGHVRRKFYERAESCGLPREFGNPSALRRARSVELLRGNLPLPVVQKLLGHSTPNLTAAFLDVSDEEMHHAVRRHIDRESRKRTSARNFFFGKISEIIQGDIQSEVILLTLGGLRISSIITNGSLKRMRLAVGTFVTAEIKAPWVFIAATEEAAANSAENRLRGTIMEVNAGRVNAEVLLRLEDGTEICSVITADSCRRLGLRVNGPAWALFGAYSVILNLE